LPLPLLPYANVSSFSIPIPFLHVTIPEATFPAHTLPLDVSPYLYETRFFPFLSPFPPPISGDQVFHASWRVPPYYSTMDGPRSFPRTSLFHFLSAMKRQLSELTTDDLEIPSREVRGNFLLSLWGLSPFPPFSPSTIGSLLLGTITLEIRSRMHNNTFPFPPLFYFYLTVGNIEFLHFPIYLKAIARLAAPLFQKFPKAFRQLADLSSMKLRT